MRLKRSIKMKVYQASAECKKKESDRKIRTEKKVPEIVWNTEKLNTVSSDNDRK